MGSFIIIILIFYLKCWITQPIALHWNEAASFTAILSLQLNTYKRERQRENDKESVWVIYRIWEQTRDWTEHMVGTESAERERDT